MLLRAYSIYDCKALQYHSPWFSSADGSALRSFQDLANDRDNRVGQHPRDYSLYFVGIWDDSNGHFSPQMPAVHVADANALLVPNTAPLFPEIVADLTEATPVNLAKLRAATKGQ